MDVKGGQLNMQRRFFPFIRDRFFEIFDRLIDISLPQFELRKEKIIVGKGIGKRGLRLTSLKLHCGGLDGKGSLVEFLGFMPPRTRTQKEERR
jgi:hypothetical protein